MTPSAFASIEFVKQHELQALLEDDSRRLSPLFRLIATPTWWKQLDQMLESDQTDRQIHTFVEQ